MSVYIRHLVTHDVSKDAVSCISPLILSDFPLSYPKDYEEAHPFLFVCLRRIPSCGSAIYHLSCAAADDGRGRFRILFRRGLLSM